jgi:hypothetical protein
MLKFSYREGTFQMKYPKRNGNKKMAKVKEEINVVSSIVSGYQNLKSSTGDLNKLGVEFAVSCGNLINAGKASGREFRASIKQAGIVKAVSVKETHAESLYLIPALVAQLGGVDKVEDVSKLLSLSTRINRNGGEIPAGNTLTELDEVTPTIKEISDKKKEDAAEDVATVEIPEIDALIVGFVAALKKATKGKMETITFGDISTKSLEEMKVILGQMSKNRKATEKK